MPAQSAAILTILTIALPSGGLVSPFSVRLRDPAGGKKRRRDTARLSEWRSAPLTRRYPAAAPADLAAAAPARRPGVLVALDLNDVVHGASRADDLRLAGQESVGPGNRDKQERTGSEAADDQKLAHEGSPQASPQNKACGGLRFREAAVSATAAERNPYSDPIARELRPDFAPSLLEPCAHARFGHGESLCVAPSSRWLRS